MRYLADAIQLNVCKLVLLLSASEFPADTVSSCKRGIGRIKIGIHMSTAILIRERENQVLSREISASFISNN